MLILAGATTGLLSKYLVIEIITLEQVIENSNAPVTSSMNCLITNTVILTS